VVLHAEDGAHEETTEKPLAYLRRWSREVRAPRLAGWPAFQGGLLALLGYELATQIEPVRSAPADVRVPLAAFLEAYEACVFDAAQQELTVVVLCPVGSPNTALRAPRGPRARPRPRGELVRRLRRAVADAATFRRPGPPARGVVR
jgi:anthranilate/para-aminobenzoate synthase component I